MSINISNHICKNIYDKNTSSNDDNNSIIVTVSPLPPTHLEYSFADSLVFGVRALDLRELDRK